MVVYTICRKTGRTLKVRRFPNTKDLAVKQIARVLAKIISETPDRKGL